MKRLLTIALTLISLSGIAQTVLWSEDFEGEANGATTGTAGGIIGGTWNVTSLPPNGAGSFSRQNTGGAARFTVNGTGDGEGVWSSGVINISAYSEVAIELNLIEFLSSNAQDYLRAYYRLNNGAEVLFGSITGGGGYDVTANASVILSGSTVEIVVRGRENSPNVFIFIPTFLRFDDIQLVAIQSLYTRANGNWTSGNTWSLTPGGPACGCTPDASTHVTIAHTVDVNGDGEAVNVIVQNGGTLRYTGDNTLAIHRGGDFTVNAGGAVNRNGNNAATVAFTWAGVTNNVVNNGTFNIGDLSIPAAATINFSGSGVLTTADDFTIDAAANVSFSGTGSYTIGDDFIVNAAATITNNKTGGTITITDDLLFNTDNATFNNNHTLSMAELVVNDSGDDGNVVTNGAAGTLTTGAISPNNGDLDINNFGTLNQSGVFTNGDLGTGSSFRNRSSGVWNWSAVGGTNDPQVASVLDCSEAGNEFNYNGAGNQTIFDIQYHHLTISNSGTKAATAAIDANGNITIQNTAVFNGANNGVNIGGNWSAVNAASFTQGSSIITFDGSGDQSVSNGSGEIFSRVVVNKPAGGIILNNDLTISGGAGTDLTLTQGIIYSSSSALLIISDGVASTSGNATSFVDGPIRKVGNDVFVFPTGKNGRFARIGISNFSGASNTSQFTAEYFDSPYGNLSVDGSLAHVSHGEHWTLTRAVNTPTARVTLYWEDSFSDITDLADLTVARYTGTDWTDAGATNAGAPAGPGTSLSAVVSSFQAFTFGSLTGVNPLPVELLYFKATLKDNEVELVWETASELNNDHFTIERASDVENFQPVTKIPGRGTASGNRKYQFTDTSPLYGRTYYRLKQTDFDGTVSFSDISAIQYEEPAHPVLSVYPNPVVSHKVTLRLDGFRNATDVPVTVSDLSGKVVQRKVISIPEGSAWTYEMDLDVTPGAYLISAGAGQRLSRILIVR